MRTKRPSLQGGWGKADDCIVKVVRCISMLSAVCLLGIMLVAFFNVLGEKIFHKGIPGSTEIVQYLHVPVVFLSAAFVTLDRGQTSIDLLSKHFPHWLQMFFSTFCFLLGVAVSAFVGCRGFIQMGKHLSTHAMSSVSGFGFPLWPFSMIFSTGFMLLSFTFLWSIVRMYAPKQPDETQENSSDGKEEC